MLFLTVFKRFVFSLLDVDFFFKVCSMMKAVTDILFLHQSQRILFFFLLKRVGWFPKTSIFSNSSFMFFDNVFVWLLSSIFYDVIIFRSKLYQTLIKHFKWAIYGNFVFLQSILCVCLLNFVDKVKFHSFSGTFSVLLLGIYYNVISEKLCADNFFLNYFSTLSVPISFLFPWYFF